MNELKNTTARTIRRKLLSTVSASALLVFLSTAGKTYAASDDADRPTIWIELGGQLDQFAPTEDPFAPPFLLKMPRPSFETTYPIDAERPPRFAIGETAKLTFQPERSDWVFSAAIRYGRSNGNRVVQQETLYPSLELFSPSNVQPPYEDNYATTKVRHDENHSIVDFQAGKDVGLGLFGPDSTSTLSVGVRIAQFASKTNVDIRERPDLHVEDFRHKYLFPVKYYHNYHLTAHSARSFKAVGPSLSWNASTPFAGNPDSTEISVDWGVNAALLFGRQKAKVSHHTSGRYYHVYSYKYQYPYNNAPAPRNSARSVTIPNLGGFAGISLKWPNAKISLGYRADFFFNAVDGGIDKRVSKTLGLNGPYASISFGVGD